MPEKTPNSEVKPASGQDPEALAEEVLDEASDTSLLDDIVEAEVVSDAESSAADQSDVIEAEAVPPPEKSYLDKPPRAYVVAAQPVDSRQRKLQTKGGAVAGVLLAALSIAGAFLTSYSLINAFIGLALSMWGLNSDSRKLAAAGAVLSIVGMILSVALKGAR